MRVRPAPLHLAALALGMLLAAPACGPLPADERPRLMTMGSVFGHRPGWGPGTPRPTARPRAPDAAGAEPRAASAAAPAAAPEPAPPANLPKLSAAAAERCQALLPQIEAAATTHGLDSALLLAMIRVESNFRPDARASSGASGLMQVMPATARGRGCEALWSAEGALACGCGILADLLRRFDGDERYAVAAYNAGAGAVQAAFDDGRAPSNAPYVERILDLRDRFEARGCAPDS